jgi:Fe-S oxidoreductase
MIKNKNKDAVTTGPTSSGFFKHHPDNLREPDLAEDPSLDFEKCIHCGYCRDVCRVYNTTFLEMDYAGGRNRVLKSLAKKEIPFDPATISDLVFKCILCGNCREVCPVGIDTVDIFRRFKKRAVEKGVIPDKLKGFRDSIIKYANPFNEEPENRYKWCSEDSCSEGHAAYERGKELYRKLDSGELKKEDVDPNLVGYYVGCTSSLRNLELVTATCRVLDMMGVNFIVFPEEKCCGSVLFRTGVDSVAAGLVDYNTEMIRRSGIKEVIFSCAGCFSTFTNEYTEYAHNNLGFKLSHVVQFVPRVAKEKNLSIKYPGTKDHPRSKEDPLIITYHDPCHLARYADVYDEPRELISMIEGIELIEMKFIKGMTHCCGAGGGVRALYGDLATNIASNRLDETLECWDHINEDRLNEALETKAEALVSGCVFCKNNLMNAASKHTLEDGSKMEVTDILQILEVCEIKPKE